MFKKNIINILILMTIVAGLSAKNNIKLDELQYILKNTAQYCELLKDKVFHFICHEKITETLYKSQSNSDNLSSSSLGRPNSPRIYKRKSTYINEYQIIKNGKKLKEWRKLLKFNKNKIGKNMKKINRMQTSIYSYKSILIPIRFFADKNQSKYDYKILKKTKYKGSKIYIIEIKKKEDPTKNINSKVLLEAWVDSSDYSIVRFDVFPEAFGGIDYLLKSNGKEKYKVKITDTHYFGLKNGGIRYPSKTRISLSYTEKFSGHRYFTKLVTKYFYKKYEFFNVTVEDPVYHDTTKL